MRMKYELNHIGFDWRRDLQVIEQGVREREVQILSKVGFYREYGEANAPAVFHHLPSVELMDEVTGKLATAAAIIMDAGYKAPSLLISTLDAVRHDPAALRERAVEPEALGVLAAWYQRAHESAGHHWYDVTEPAHSELPSNAKVKDAVDRGIAYLKKSAAKGRRKKIAHEYLAAELCEIYLRFNLRLVRHSAIAESGSASQVEGGPLIVFLDEVLAPLNRFLASLPAEYGERGPISGASIARRAIESDRSTRARRFNQRLKFVLSF